MAAASGPCRVALLGVCVPRSCRVTALAGLAARLALHRLRAPSISRHLQFGVNLHRRLRIAIRVLVPRVQRLLERGLPLDVLSAVGAGKVLRHPLLHRLEPDCPGYPVHFALLMSITSVGHTSWRSPTCLACRRNHNSTAASRSHAPARKAPSARSP